MSESNKEIFDGDIDASNILKRIRLYYPEFNIVDGNTLLFLDEIQECPKAITALKYFCENLRELHIVCAGSLLGVALKQENVSFPVGKVNRMHMYPMNFKEFVIAMGEERFVSLFETWCSIKTRKHFFSSGESK